MGNLVTIVWGIIVVRLLQSTLDYAYDVGLVVLLIGLCIIARSIISRRGK